MFAGSCIGVIFLVLFLEFLRRLGKEDDRFLARQGKQHSASQTLNPNASEEPLNGYFNAADPKHNHRDHTGIVTTSRAEYQSSSSRNGRRVRSPVFRPSKPNTKQQLIRALLHMLQFGVAYFIMLLAMYYNGYIIICILVGTFLGAFIFSWDAIGTEQGAQEELCAADDIPVTDGKDK
jgi:solute carrier family 31 (copper transporter), member 1